MSNGGVAVHVRRRSLSCFLMVLTLVLAQAVPALADPEWGLTYVRQYGRFHNAGGSLAEVFATNEDGSFAQVGITNKFNSGFAVFGNTNPPWDPFKPGNLRIQFDPNVDPYDFQVYDPGTPTEGTPDLWWNQPALPNQEQYSFEVHFRRVSDDAQTTFFPQAPVYHYDLVDTLNTSSTEAANYASDNYGLTDWSTYQAQTFVVPAGVNRIIEAKAFCIRGAGDGKFRMVASIREGGPTGPQIGPSVTSREVNSNEFNNVLMCWGIDDVPVTPGQTYALRLDSSDGVGFNCYGTDNNNYPNGNMYNGTASLTGRDLVGVVVGAFRSTGGPTATPTPGGPTPTPTPTNPPGTCNFNNPGFESGLTSWSRTENDPTFYTTGSEFGYSPNSGSSMFGGTHSYTDGGSSDIVYQTLCTTGGTQYAFSAWAITGQVGGTADNCRVRLVADLNGGTNFTDLSGWQSPTSWTQLTAPFTATGGNATLGIEIEQQSSLQWNHYYVDDANLAVVSGGPTATPTVPGPTATPTATPTTPPSGTNVLANPSFEQSSGGTHPSWVNNADFGTNGNFPNPFGAQDGSNWASYSLGTSTLVAQELYQTVNVSAGVPYAFSMYHNTGGTGGTVSVLLQWIDGAYSGKGNGATLDSATWNSGEPQTGWEMLSGNATPTGSQITFILRVEINGWSGGTNLDDCSLIAQGTPPTPTPTTPPTVTPTPTPTTPPATATPTASPTATPTPTIPAGAVVRIDPAQLEVHNGPTGSVTTTVAVALDNVTDLGAFQFTLGYNGDAVQIANAADVSLGGFLGSTGNTPLLVGPVIDNGQAGELTFGASTLVSNPGPNGSGIGASIVWTTQFVSERTVVPLTLSGVLVTDTLGGSIPVTAQSGELILCYFADRDCDDTVDIVDIQLVASKWNTFEGDGDYDPSLDVNGDGRIDIIDIQLVAARWNTAAPFAP